MSKLTCWVSLLFACGCASSNSSVGGVDTSQDGSADLATGGSSTGGGGGTVSTGTVGENGGAAGRSAGQGGTGVADAGGTSFDPCPLGKPCAVMPFGDSITAGSGSSGGGGYRVELFAQTVEAGKSLTFVGSQSSGPDTVGGVPFPKHNEGYPGYTIDGKMGILPLAATALHAGKPNIVLLMIGTNDVNGYVDLANAPARLGNLIDTVVDTDPNLLLVVAKIVPTTDDAENGRIQPYNDAIPAVVAARVTAGKHVILVDMYSAFTANAGYKTEDMFNFIHPNDAGYVVMGDVWFAAIQSYLH